MRHRAVALILAAALSFSLAGCFGLGDKSEDSTGLTNMLTDMAENAAEIARELEGIDWSKTVRAVVYDADGTQVAEITDQAQIDEIFSPLPGERPGAHTGRRAGIRGRDLGARDRQAGTVRRRRGRVQGP